MVEKLKCPSCHGKRTVPCPCCSGIGWVQTTPVSRLGKAYSCADCSGLGEIPCPRCRPGRILLSSGLIRANYIRQ